MKTLDTESAIHAMTILRNLEDRCDDTQTLIQLKKMEESIVRIYTSTEEAIEDLLNKQTEGILNAMMEAFSIFRKNIGFFTEPSPEEQTPCDIKLFE